jgi:hypothetical protein
MNIPPPVHPENPDFLSKNSKILLILLIDSLPLTLRAALGSLSPLRSDSVKKF